MHQPVEYESPLVIVQTAQPKVESCNCTGDCQHGFDPANCVQWLARTHKMTLEHCPNSNQRTWHRDGKCAACNPLFQSQYEWGSA